MAAPAVKAARSKGVTSLRKAKCYECGKIYLTDVIESYLCPECTQKSKMKFWESTERICIDCGKSFKGHTGSFRCPDCQYLANLERQRKFEKHGPQRKLGSYDNCQRCGKQYVVTNGKQKYCPECAAEAAKENARLAAIKRYHLKVTPEARKEKKRKRQKICIVCGEPFAYENPSVTCSPECALIHLRQANAKAKKMERERLKNGEKPKKAISKSGIVGVYALGNKWKVDIRHNKKRVYLGVYDTIDEAAEAKERYLAEEKNEK